MTSSQVKKVVVVAFVVLLCGVLIVAVAVKIKGAGKVEKMSELGTLATPVREAQCKNEKKGKPATHNEPEMPSTPATRTCNTEHVFRKCRNAVLQRLRAHIHIHRQEP